MDQDRSNWGVREYADALNRAATPADLFALIHEVNQKWATPDDSLSTRRSPRRWRTLRARWRPSRLDLERKAAQSC
jgi:hypothetical protein